MPISKVDAAVRRQQAVQELDAVNLVDDPAEVVNNLHYGLSLLRELLFERVHLDVESRFGVDSMLMPISVNQTEEQAKHEIDCFQVVEAARQAAMLYGEEAPAEWFTAWLTRWRLGAAADTKPLNDHLEKYTAADARDRQHLFSVILERTLPEATQAPLILYRLFPLAVQLVVASSMVDVAAAQAIRRQQIALLSAVADCPACRGRVLDCGESCSACGNPLWKFEVLLAD